MVQRIDSLDCLFVRSRLPKLLFVIACLMLVTGCDRPVINTESIQAIHKVAWTGYFDGSQLHLVGAEADERDEETASNGDPALTSDQAFELVAALAALQDSLLTGARIPQDGPFTMVDSQIPDEYVVYLADPSEDYVDFRAELAEAMEVDGLLYLGRSYRLRAELDVRGDRYSKWRGEVVSSARLYDQQGHLAFDMTWVSNSTDVEIAKSISADRAGELTLNATEVAVQNTLDILNAVAAGRKIPDHIRSMADVNALQERGSIGFDFGTGVRGMIILGMIFLAVFAWLFVGDSRGLKRITILLGALLLTASIIYLLFVREWWADVIVTIIDIITDAIFG